MSKALRQFIYFILVGCFIVFLVSACNPVRNETVISLRRPMQDCRIVNHFMGQTCIPHNPQRVVTVWIHTLANSLALGVKPIASTYVSGFPLPPYLQGRVDGIESIGGVNDPNLEKVLRLNPDLILSTSRLKQIYQQLTYIAPVAVLNIPFPPPSWKQQLMDTAQVLDKEKTSQQVLAEYGRRVEKIQRSLGNQRTRMTISVANTSSEYGIWAYGEGHPCGEVLKDIGFQRPPIQRGKVYYTDRISEEHLLDIDGDVLFFITWGRENDKKTLERLKQRPLWQHLKAVQNNRVYFVEQHWHGVDVLAMNAVLDDLEKYLVDAP
jgi:iron complex transport system substrate-binding protein